MIVAQSSGSSFIANDILIVSLLPAADDLHTKLQTGDHLYSYLYTTHHMTSHSVTIKVLKALKIC